MQIKFVSGITQIATLTIAAASFIAPAHAADLLNQPPVISGTPAITTVAGTMYSFQPMASDANADQLVFSVTSKPSWARLDRTSGRFYGSPTNAEAGVYEQIEISVSDGKSRTKLPKFALTVVADATLGRAPSISGTPVTSVAANSAYSFQPGAMDLDGDKLTFSMTGRPAWATLDKATGRLAGTPTTAQIGTYANVEIAVSDGINTTKLPKFSVSVTAAAVTTRAMTLSWLPPTQNTDGTALTTLSGYRIMYGTAPGQYTTSIDVNTAGVTSFMVENLQPGKYFIVIAAKNAAGAQSAFSNEATTDLT